MRRRRMRSAIPKALRRPLDTRVKPQLYPERSPSFGTSPKLVCEDTNSASLSSPAPVRTAVVYFSESGTRFAISPRLGSAETSLWAALRRSRLPIFRPAN